MILRFYQVYEAILHGVSPMVWRRLKIPGNISLAQLHHTIQIAFGWDDEAIETVGTLSNAEGGLGQTNGLKSNALSMPMRKAPKNLMSLAQRGTDTLN